MIYNRLLINARMCKCLLICSQHNWLWIILSFISLMAQQKAAELMQGLKGRENDYFQPALGYRWEKGKLSAGDVHQRPLERSHHVSWRAPTPVGVFISAGCSPLPSTSPAQLNTPHLGLLLAPMGEAAANRVNMQCSFNVLVQRLLVLSLCCFRSSGRFFSFAPVFCLNYSSLCAELKET